MTKEPAEGSGRPKRTRRQAAQEEPTASTVTAAPAVKRRRLNGPKPTSTAAPPAPAPAPTLASNGRDTNGRRSARNKTAQKEGQDTKSIYDRIPGSSEDETREEAPPTEAAPAIKYRKLGLRRPQPKPKPKPKPAPLQPEAVYEVPDSDDELQAPKPVEESEDSKQLSPSKKKVGNGLSQNLSQGAEGESKPKRRGRPPKIKAPIGASTARKGPVAARLAKSVVDTQKEAPQLKGILTPQKKKLGRPRKTVAFDGDVAAQEREVFFEDLPSKLKSSDKAKKKHTEIHIEEDQASDNGGNEDAESEDDEVCTICLKPDSEPPNEIIFCETCDMAVHQECYDVPVIPEGDWICRNCSQEDVVSGSKPTSKTQEAIRVKPACIPKIPNFEQHLDTMKRVLLDRCAGNRRIKLQGQSESYDKAFQLVEQTVLAGEGNSMMVIGARGCGKTTLVDTIVSDLAAEHRDEFHVVRLNGFIHTDDKLALKDIWRQLGREMELEDDLVNKTSNYADTMASLLALLSHPADITGAEEGMTSKSVIFIIDEFDLFATHARQTLLYNLFDIAQARKAPIAVLGLTTRVDVVESLEKRVKSRFSHRYVYMSVPKTLQAYWEACRQGLVVDEEDLKLEGFDTRLEGLSEFHEYWARKIEALRKTPKFEDHLEYLYYTSKSVPAFLTSCVLPLSALSTSSLDLEFAPSPASYAPLEPLDSRHYLLSALSDLEMALLISAARLDIVAHTDTVNFAMAYDEYTSQMGKQRVQSAAASSGVLALGAAARAWGRATAAVAWERLVSLGLLIPAGIGGRSNALHGGLEGKMWKLDVALEEIPPAVVELPGFLAKWCTQI
ncbi:origin recognition complex subunit 4 [Diatrype stigma]|uniref:Origin recognition complex subunit 4 n=1 Tax=Diatrype stigma TaxID=117547 RepID=A0AAN9YQU8_9PEZI